jgi:hypothetical protein
VENGPAGEPSEFALHALMPLEDFKALLAADGREDALRPVLSFDGYLRHRAILPPPAFGKNHY